jgi:deazaflavin-dependent oxidoreductase (nitroreductase family)
MSSDASQRGSVPVDMKAFNQKVVEEFRANNGRLSGPLEKSQLILLTTKGARSGREHTVVIGYRPHGQAFAVIASNNGAPGSPAWYHNLMADPTATVEVGADRFKARARVAQLDERAELARKIEYFAQQQAKTEREIPIVVLERIE